MNLAQLPAEVLSHVCLFCKVADIVALACASKRFLNLVQPILDRRAAEILPPSTCIEYGSTGAFLVHLRKGLDLTLMDHAVDWDVFGRPTTYGSLLHLAVYCDNLEALNLLLEHGADPNVRDTAFSSPLNTAVRYGRNAFARQLVFSGADVHAHNEEKVTVLHHAARRGNVELTRTLLKLGANPHDRDIHGDTPLHIAGGAEVVMELIDAGADIFAVNNAGTTPLQSLPEVFFRDMELDAVFDKGVVPLSAANFDVQCL